MDEYGVDALYNRGGVVVYRVEPVRQTVSLLERRRTPKSG